MNLQQGVRTRALPPTTTTPPAKSPDVICVLYSVFKTLRAARISCRAYTSALMSVEPNAPSPTDHCLLADPVRVAGAIFRHVVLHDQHYLPLSLNAMPPFRYGTGRTLWASVQEAASTFDLIESLDSGVKNAALTLVSELMEEGGFLRSGDTLRQIKAGSNNQIAQLLSNTETLRDDGCHVKVSIVKFVGDRHFTILRLIGDKDAVGCLDVQEISARNNDEIFHALGVEEPSTLNVCVEFGMLRQYLYV